MMVCDRERIALCNNEINEFCLKLKFFSFQPPNMTVKKFKFGNLIKVKNYESKMTCYIKELTTKRRELFKMKDPKSTYFVVYLSNNSFYKMKLKMDYCLCLLDQFNKQSKSKHRVFKEFCDRYGLVRVENQNEKCKGSPKDPDEETQHQLYAQKKSLPFGSYEKISISRDFVKALNLEKDWHIDYNLNVIIDYKKFWPDLLKCNIMYDLTNVTAKEAIRILNQRGFQIKMQPKNVKSYLKSSIKRTKLNLVKAMRELGNALSFKK